MQSRAAFTFIPLLFRAVQDSSSAQKSDSISCICFSKSRLNFVHLMRPVLERFRLEFVQYPLGGLASTPYLSSKFITGKLKKSPV